MNQPANDAPRARTALPLLTNSAKKTFLSCPRAYLHRYEQCVRPISDGDALQFGSLTHVGLEAWWLSAKSTPYYPCPDCAANPGQCSTCSGSGNVAPMFWLTAAMQAIATEPDPYRLAAVEAMLTGYTIRWSDMKWQGHPIEVVDVEVQFEGGFTNPASGALSRTWQRGGKIDILLRIDDLYYVGEHKTSSEDFRAGSDYRRRLILDSQVSYYHIGAGLIGKPIHGCIYDVLAKPGAPKKATPVESQRWTKGSAKEPSRLDKRQRLTDETPEEYKARICAEIVQDPDRWFARFDVPRLAADVHAAATNDWQVAEMIRDARTRNRWPQNPDACNRYGRWCEYHPVCTGQATLEDGTRYRRAETAHEELVVVNDTKENAA